jgi:hypothetical protein
LGVQRSAFRFAAYGIREDDPQETIYPPGKLQSFQIFPFDMVAAAGDVIQNVRSSLDHLANHLVLVNGQRPTKNTCFPISENFDTYEREKGKKVKGMRADAKEAIDRVKPYGGGNEFLWKLHELNNIDKHRLLFTVRRDVMYTGDWINHPFGGSYNSFLMKTGDPHFVGVFNGEAEDQIQFQSDETLTEPQVSHGDALLPFLHRLVSFIEDVILSFEPRLA